MSTFLHISRCYNCGSKSDIIFISSQSNILHNTLFKCICSHCGDHSDLFSDSKENAVLEWNDYQSLKASLSERDIEKIQVIPEEQFTRKRFVGDSWGSCFDMVRKSSLRKFIHQLLTLKHTVNNTIDAAETLDSEVM